MSNYQHVLPVTAVPDKQEPDIWYKPHAKSSQKLRVDGKYIQCGWPGCFHASKDLNFVTQPSHYVGHHGYPDKNSVPSHEAIKNTVVLIDKATYKARSQQRLQQKKDKERNRPTIVEPLPAHIAAQAHPPSAVPPPQAPAANAPHNRDDEDQEQRHQTLATWKRHICYICRKTYPSRQDAKNHMREDHEDELVTEPLQPDRIVEAECYKNSDKIVQLLQSSTMPQKPTFANVCRETRLLIFRERLTVPTSFYETKGALDPFLFNAFFITRAMQPEVLTSFHGANFLIVLNVYSYGRRSFNIFESHALKELPLIDAKRAKLLGKPALTIGVDIKKSADNSPTPWARQREEMQERLVQSYTLVFTERGFIDVLGAIQLHYDSVEEVRIDFARYAHLHCYKEIKQTVDLYLTFLHGVTRVSYYEDEKLVRTDHSAPQDFMAIQQHGPR